MESGRLMEASPRGGDPGLMWGNTGTLWGLSNKFLPLWWGKCGDFASVQLRGDWERSIARLIDDKMAEEKFRKAYKLLRIVKFKYSQEC